MGQGSPWEKSEFLAVSGGHINVVGWNGATHSLKVQCGDSF